MSRSELSPVARTQRVRPAGVTSVQHSSATRRSRPVSRTPPDGAARLPFPLPLPLPWPPRRSSRATSRTRPGSASGYPRSDSATPRPQLADSSAGRHTDPGLSYGPLVIDAVLRAKPATTAASAPHPFTPRTELERPAPRYCGPHASSTTENPELAG